MVSHGQGSLVANLLADLAECAQVAEVIVTLNVPEPDIACPDSLRSRMRVVRNSAPLGFGANHNQAFALCRTPCFAVVNPDVRLLANPFSTLLRVLDDQGTGVAVPAVVNPDGGREDSTRRFPTLSGLLGKAFGHDESLVAAAGDLPIAVDWAAGMFLVFRSETFRRLGGFDAGYFLYYEDVDLCVRLWKAGLRVLVHPGVTVIHSARRDSRKRIRYMVWHLSSMARYFFKHFGRLPSTGVRA
ncbi:MAG: glycosyltransferase family 2 protein [Azonexus sp.]|nr:glycosyltransferase family 2 protein [Azonexus sp.]MBP6906433.1 glycosyltransferase family 2 protein [Azonexus sp.]